MGVVIEAITAVVPKEYKDINDLSIKYGVEEANRIVKSIGVKKRHIANPHITTVDLGEDACHSLFKEKGYEPGDFQGIVFITQTPDYKTPASACILQHRLGLSKQSLAFDINLGCSAYPYGIMLVTSLLHMGLAQKILLIVGDTSSKVIHTDDRATYPLFGDGVAVTVLGTSDQDSIIGYDLGTDGEGENNLIIPVGQMRYRTESQYVAAAPIELSQNVKFSESINMNGNEIFTFTLREVPGIIKRVLTNSDFDIDQVDYFIFHQANLFILNHLIKKMKLPIDKCPLSISDYGNTSGASPALTACACLAEENRKKKITVMFVGFGVGYSWGGVLAKLSKGTLTSIKTV